MTGNVTLGRDIFIIEKYFRLYFKNALREYDLNSMEALVLHALFGKDGEISGDLFEEIHCRHFGATQDEIISELHYDKGAMTRTMQSLESKQYVVRKENPGDSRSYLFSTTEKADNFKPVLLEILRNWNELLLKDIDNLDAVIAATTRMAQNAKHAAKGE